MVSKNHTTAIIAVLAVTLIFASTAFAQTISFEKGLFSRNLRVGDRGEDVKILQKVLNSSSETRLGDAGPGAPGEETTYFGELTKSAVVKFQEKHALEILSPVQLVQGTGFVGPMTRKKLNEVAKVAGITQGSTVETPSGGSTEVVGSSQGTVNKTGVIVPKIFSISPTKISNGDMITITGEGFASEGNIVQTTFYENRNATSTDGKTITFRFYSDALREFSEAHSQTASTTNGLPTVVVKKLQELNIPLPSVSGAEPLPSNLSFMVPIGMSVENKNGESNAIIVDVNTSPGQSEAVVPVSKKTLAKSVLSRVRSVLSNMNPIAPKETLAQVFLPFGGLIVYTWPCICSASWGFWIIPANVSPIGPYNLYYATMAVTLKMNYRPFVSRHVVGGYNIGQCVIFTGKYCVPIGGYTVTPIPGVGTS